MGVPVSRAQLECSLEQLSAEVRDARAGLYGPGSISWRIDRESILFLAGGRAALLQLAHPFVAHAIDQHSNTRSDPLGRFQRTFTHVFDMVFGELDHALASARRVHAIHERITGQVGENVGRYAKGTPYQANDDAALFWVQATLIDSAVLAYEQVVAPLSLDEKERYYREARRFSLLFGIDEAVMPPTWSDFEDYTLRMHEELAVGEPARNMAAFLLSPAALRPEAVARWYRTMTTGLLPRALRKAFGLPWSTRHKLTYRASLAALRRSYRLVPLRLRAMPAYADAMRRLAGKQGRDPVGQWVERHILHAVVS